MNSAMDFDPALLRAFVAVKETGGFTRAAERLHLSQSAVSHQIRRLEQLAGTALLVRTTRSLRLTEDGEQFLSHAEQVLQAHEALARRFQRADIDGVIRFGVPENFMDERLPPLLTRFAQLFPAVRLDVTVATYLELRTQVDAGALDMAVLMSLPTGPERDQYEGTVLRHTRFVWAAAPTFQLAGHGPLPMAFAPSPCLHRQVGVAALEEAGVAWRVAFTSPSQQGLRAAVLAGFAMTALPQGDLEANMVVVDAQHGLPPLPAAAFSMICSSKGQAPAAMALAQLLAEMPTVL